MLYEIGNDHVANLVTEPYPVKLPKFEGDTEITAHRSTINIRDNGEWRPPITVWHYFKSEQNPVEREIEIVALRRLTRLRCTCTPHLIQVTENGFEMTRESGESINTIEWHQNVDTFALTVIHQLKALEEIVAVGVVHADIYPKNLLERVDLNGKPLSAVIIDFGRAGFVWNEELYIHPQWARKVPEGISAEHLDPEQFQAYVYGDFLLGQLVHFDDFYELRKTNNALFKELNQLAAEMTQIDPARRPSLSDCQHRLLRLLDPTKVTPIISEYEIKRRLKIASRPTTLVREETMDKIDEFFEKPSKKPF